MDRTSDLAVDSVTGVDVALPVAGPGARSFAFLIDWLIRTVLSVAWYVVAALLHNGGWSLVAPLVADANWFVFVVAPAGAIYFFYHPVWEVMTRGLTPGKRMAGLRTVSRDGGAPGVGSILTRNVFRLVDSFPVAHALGLITTMFTRNNVRIGDLAAGTLLVYVRNDTTLAQIPGRQIDAKAAEVLSELLQRWGSLDSDARRRIAASLLKDIPAATDEDLRRQLEILATRGTQ